MNSRDPKDLVQSYLRGWTTGDYALLDSILAPDVECWEQGRFQDHGALYDAVSSFSRAFSDSRFKIDLWLMDGEVVVCHYSFEGDHTGRLPLDPPLDEALGKETITSTGRRVRTTGTLICEVKGDRIHRVISEFDRLTLLTKIGAFGYVAPEIVEVPELQSQERWWQRS